MKRLLVLSVTALALAATALVPATASAGGCNKIKLSGKSYVFYKNNIGCDRAKTKARRLHRTKNEPRRFNCSSGSNYRTGGYCQHKRRPGKYFGWHPWD